VTPFIVLLPQRIAVMVSGAVQHDVVSDAAAGGADLFPAVDIGYYVVAAAEDADWLRVIATWTVFCQEVLTQAPHPLALFQGAPAPSD